MERRRFALSMLAALALPSLAAAPSKAARVGWLSAGRAELDVGLVDAFLKAAKAIGLVVPRPVLARADYVIE